MLRNKIGPVFNARNGSFVFVFFLKKSSSFCRENEIFKNNKTKRRKLGPVFNTEKGNIGPAFNSTAYTYIYICCSADNLAMLS